METGTVPEAESGGADADDTVEETAGADDDAPAKDRDGDGNEGKPSRRRAPAATGPAR